MNYVKQGMMGFMQITPKQSQSRPQPVAFVTGNNPQDRHYVFLNRPAVVIKKTKSINEEK
jgi:hypothetical protein